jgi:Tol biopolymer transport system component
MDGMNRPRDPEMTITDWLSDEGPQDVPARAIDLALTTTRDMRQTRPLPTWLLTLTGDPMETTLRRPMPLARLTFALLVALLALLLAAGAAIVGSRMVPPAPLLRALAAIPQGGEAAFTYSAFAGSQTTVYTVRADGTDQRVIGPGFDPAWSPDGSMIAYMTGDEQQRLAGLVVADADGIRPVISITGCRGDGPVWSPDNRFIVYSVVPDQADCTGTGGTGAEDQFVIPADGSSSAHPMLSTTLEGHGHTPVWSPTGRTIAFASGDDKGLGLWLADVTDPDAPWALVPRRLTKPGAYGPWSYQLARWSPDGTMLAAGRVADGATAWETVVTAADGGSETVLWPGPEDHSSPEWSPDGTRLNIVRHHGPGASVQPEPYDLYLIGPDGSDPQLILAGVLNGWGGPLPFSPDGSRVIGRDRTYSLLVVVTLDDPHHPVIIDAPSANFGISWQPVINTRSPLAWPSPSPAAST